MAAGLSAAPSSALPAGSARGDLRARFVFDGPPPERKRIQVTADIEFCGKRDLYEEKLVVNPTNGGVANVVAWLVTSTHDSAPPVRSTDQPHVAEINLDAEGCRFEPHVTLLRTDQTLVIHNRNPIGDSAKIDTLNNPGINILLPIEGQIRCQFPMPERLPAQVSCTVHPWEMGWLIIKDHPYMAVSDRDGNLRLNGVPTGKWTFQFWHETARYLTQARIRGELRNLSRGRLELDVTAGQNDLGEVRLAPQLFTN